MNDFHLIQQIADILCTEAWWKPIMGFMFTNCGKFKQGGNSHEEYSVFSELRTMIADLFESYLPKQLNTRSSAIENVLFENSESSNKQVQGIISTLTSYTDFMKVKKWMIKINNYIEDFTTQQMLAIQSQNGDDDSMMDVVSILEKGEQAALAEKTANICSKMKEKLKPDPSTPIYSPCPSPKSILGQALSSHSKKSLPTITTPSPTKRGPVIMKPRISK